MSRCQVLTINKNGITECRISGCIDDSLGAFSDVFLKHTKLIINLDEVSAINSLGIREWINLMTTLQKEKITLTHCPKVFIDQVNMVKGFLPGNCVIESFYVPYYSEQTSQEKKILFQKNVNFPEKKINYNPKTVGNDGVIYEIDIIPGKYFKFLTD